MSITATRFLLALAAIALSGSVACADDYPSRTIRLVVGFAAGGSTDIPARYVADKLGELLGQRVIVENKPAAAGMLATRDVLAQPKDGYNLLLCTHFESINRAVYRNAQFELSDLAPISLISKYYYGLALANAVPATDLRRSSPTPRPIPARSATAPSAPDRRRRSSPASSSASPASP